MKSKWGVDLKSAEIMIHCAWIAAVISGIITLVGIIAGGFGLDAFGLIDVGVLWGLALGVFFKSRICSLLLLLYFIANQVFALMESESLEQMMNVMSLSWLLMYVVGVLGTFIYHDLKKQE